MLFISNQGSIFGPNLQVSEKSVIVAIDRGYTVKIDVWIYDRQFYIGTVKDKYQTSFSFLFNHRKNLIIESRNQEANQFFSNQKQMFHYFRSIDYRECQIKTNKGLYWCPTKPIKMADKSIYVLPEISHIFTMSDLYNHVSPEILGICSNHIGQFKIDNDKS
jgi:hypothetical protein